MLAQNRSKCFFRKKQKTVRPVIVRLTTFKNRPMFYRDRKGLFKNRMHLNLNKEGFALYWKVRDLVKSKKSVNYVYVDVSYQLNIKSEK